MGEIRSTLDIIMEKAGRVTVTDSQFLKIPRFPSIDKPRQIKRD